MRQPLEDRTAACAQAIVAATTPRSRATSKLSGPLLDRIDLHVEVSRVSFDEISARTLAERSEPIRARVEAARTIQRERYASRSYETNAELRSADMRTFAQLDARGTELLRAASATGRLSARARSRRTRLADDRRSRRCRIDRGRAPRRSDRLSFARARAPRRVMLAYPTARNATRNETKAANSRLSSCCSPERTADYVRRHSSASRDALHSCASTSLVRGILRHLPPSFSHSEYRSADVRIVRVSGWKVKPLCGRATTARAPSASISA